MELVDRLFRREHGRIIATLVRVLGPRHLDLAEEAAQDALVRALELWPFEGVPPNPSAWLILTAKRRAIDRLRRDRRLEHSETALLMAAAPSSSAELDDQLAMIQLCCHPHLEPDLQVALTLQIVCGLNAREIARGFLLPESTVSQRLVRAKRQIREQALGFDSPGALPSVLAVVYLLFNEGYAATRGDAWFRSDLCEEAIRLVRLLAGHRATARPETHALAALLLLQASRLAARLDETGDPLRLADQDRTRWDHSLIAEGYRYLELAASGTELSTYHLEAEIAATHAAAPSFERTDWYRIVHCYDELLLRRPSPAVRLNRAVAVGYLSGPAAAIHELTALEADPQLRSSHLLPAALAEFHRQIGDRLAASIHYRLALERVSTSPEQRFLARRLKEVSTE
ncbi:MAG: sigma-70 family RNA polymerase sigma factor [Bryobacteraceae bacterium]|nr:sigma-70 family RNA polymerase sigma factor [Bryobacteraceae bacterium]